MTNEPNDVQQQADQVAVGDDVKAWEQVEPGRFMPRRIRGSFRGNKLG